MNEIMSGGVEPDNMLLYVELGYALSNLTKGDGKKLNTTLSSIISSQSTNLMNSNILPELLSSEDNFPLIESLYFSDCEDEVGLGVMALHCLSSVFSPYREGTLRASEFVVANQEVTMEYLRRPDTSAMILGILTRLDIVDPGWLKTSGIDIILKEFLLEVDVGDSESVDLLVKSLNPDYFQINFPNLFLQIMGFSRLEADNVVDSWETAYDNVHTMAESILPNMLRIIFLEQASPGSAAFLYETFGITNFARHDLQQYLRQMSRLSTTNGSFDVISSPVVLALQSSYDASGAFLENRGNRSELWSQVSSELESMGVDLVVGEFGSRGRNSVVWKKETVDLILSLADIYPNIVQIIFTAHGTDEGIVMSYDSDLEIFKYLSLDDLGFVSSIFDQVLNMNSGNSNLILDTCHSEAIRKPFVRKGLKVLNASFDKSCLLAVKSNDCESLTPIFQKFD